LKKTGTNNVTRIDQHLEYSSFLNNVFEDSSVIGCYIVLFGKELLMFGTFVVPLSLGSSSPRNINNARWLILHWSTFSIRYTLSKKNSSAWNFVSLEPEVTCGTVAIIIQVVLLSPHLRIRGVSLSSIHYTQSHRVYINRRQQYICLIW